MLLIYEDESQFQNLGEEERGRIMKEYFAYYEAAAAYRRALELADSEPERRFLSGRLEEVGAR